LTDTPSVDERNVHLVLYGTSLLVFWHEGTSHLFLNGYQGRFPEFLVQAPQMFHTRRNLSLTWKILRLTRTNLSSCSK
jgi:hypothetical protein